MPDVPAMTITDLATLITGCLIVWGWMIWSIVRRKNDEYRRWKRA